MTASRFAHTQVLESRSKEDRTTFTFHGKGYTYHLHKTAQDVWAKLQIARETMKKFISRVGACNTVHLPGLNVCDQGVGGWFEIFVIDERKLWAVIHFIKRLNRWMNDAHVIVPPNKRRHYFVQVREFTHTPPRHLRHAPYREQPQNVIPFTPPPLTIQPKVVPTARLEHLAATVNARYGH